MAIKYYDDAIVDKIKKWMPEESNLRILGPDETARLFETMADDSKDSAVVLPMLALSRSKDITINSNIKQDKSFRGFAIEQNTDTSNKNGDKSAILNAIPIAVNYQLDIYAKTQYEAEEYIREFLFKFINNPLLVIEFPYGNLNYIHTANLRVLSTVSDTSDITNHLFKGQFYRWTIQLELQDGFLFNVPYKKNWRFNNIDLKVNDSEETNSKFTIEHICKLSDFEKK